MRLGDLIRLLGALIRLLGKVGAACSSAQGPKCPSWSANDRTFRNQWALGRVARRPYVGGMAAAAGWYPDPSGAYESRYWDGVRWTEHVHGTGTPPVGEAAVRSVVGVEPDVRDPRATVLELRGAIASFLDDMVARQRLDQATRDRLNRELVDWTPGGRPVALPEVPRAVPAVPATSGASARVVSPARVARSGPGSPAPPSPPPPGPVVRPSPPSPPPPGPVVRPSPPSPPPPGPMVRPSPPIATPRPPSAASAWWARRRSTISADLAVHGLAYLGVTLVFTGVLGFVIFAFGDVGDAWRPVAELALPLVCFGSAAFLHRRGAPFVSAALEFLGGLLLPIVGVASLADGAAVPPDLDGASLVGTLMVMSLGLAGAYALVVRRRPRSPLRLLVAPMVWLAVASLGLVFAPTIAGGRDVSRPFSLQWALVAAAVAATLGFCRRRPDGPVARASVVAAIPGAALAALMTVLAAPRSGWPAGAMVLAGVSTLVSIELLAPRLRVSAVTVLQAVTVVGTAATLGPQFGGAWAAAVAAIGLLALAEWQALRRADSTALAALTGGGGRGRGTHPLPARAHRRRRLDRAGLVGRPSVPDPERALGRRADHRPVRVPLDGGDGPRSAGPARHLAGRARWMRGRDRSGRPGHRGPA